MQVNSHQLLKSSNINLSRIMHWTAMRSSNLYRALLKPSYFWTSSITPSHLKSSPDNDPSSSSPAVLGQKRHQGNKRSNIKSDKPPMNKLGIAVISRGKISKHNENYVRLFRTLSSPRQLPIHFFSEIVLQWTYSLFGLVLFCFGVFFTFSQPTCHLWFCSALCFSDLLLL